MDKKYEFTGETMEFDGRTLHRIRYVRFVYPFTKKGGLGGWIESEDNLSHEGNCCVLDEAKVFGNARVMDDALISDYAIVKDNAEINENAKISEFSVIGADTIVSGTHTWVEGTAKVYFYNTPEETSPLVKKHGVLAHIYGTDETGVVIEGNSFIEATGFIKNCLFENVIIHGSVELEDNFSHDTTINN